MFDYIVAGAGTAGCTIAARLSENPGTQVLLIEAGPPDRALGIRIPAAYPNLFRTPLDWNYATEPQRWLQNRQLYWPAGKVLGGSGSINAMIHLRGCPADYDSWEMPGWRFDDLARLFDASPVQAAPPKSPHALSHVFLQACSAVGIARHDEFQGPAVSGSGLFPVAIRSGRRLSAADALLRPALRRGNLTVWTRTHVNRVIIENGRATGIEYRRDGSGSESSHRENSSREVILCAGAVASPRLLLLSGVGPPAQLEKLGIPVAAGLEGVGAGLQDHPSVTITYRPLTSSPSGARSQVISAALNQLKYLARKTGPLGSNRFEAGAFVKLQPELADCDVCITFAPLESSGGFRVAAALLTPQSRGSVTLTSADPTAPPRVDPGYLSHPGDLGRLANGLDLARRIAEAQAFDPYRGLPFPGGLEDPEAYIRSHADASFHSVGGCRMGQDGGSVVDGHLRVHGVPGLRVADASIIPVIPRAHPNATVMMIAEKAALLLRE